MKKLLVPTDPRHAMEAIYIGAGSSFDCILLGIDARYETVTMAFGVSGDSYANRVTAKAMPGGEWKVNAPAAHFASSYSAHYHVMGTVDGASQYLGGGTLRVLAAVPPAPTPTPAPSAD